MQLYLHDHFAEPKEALVSLLDLGLLRGYGVFDYLRTYARRPFHLQEHLERLAFSCKEVSLPLPYSLQHIEEILLELIARSEMSSLELGLKILITGGVSEDSLRSSKQTSFFAWSLPLTLQDHSLYDKGIIVYTTRAQRILPHCKTTHYLEAILTLQKHPHASEVLYINAQDEIQEGATSNFFAIKQGTLITPPARGILLGITREVLLHIAPLPIEIRPIHYSELSTIDEAFVSSSTKELLPISYIDDKPIGSGLTGPITKNLMQHFQSYTKQEHWSYFPICRHKNDNSSILIDK